jgi:hypothetical protein
MLSVMLAVPLIGSLSDVNLTVRFNDETPGLRFRDDPDSLFVRSATVFEDDAGQSTPDVLADAMAWLGTRYGVEAACPATPVVDVFNSDFTTVPPTILFTNGAWAFYTEADLEGGACPQTSLDPRQPTFYMETIRQEGDFDVDIAIGGLPLLWGPDVSIIQVLVLPNKPGIELGGTYVAEHGAYTLNALNPADLLTPYDDFIYGTMVLDWGLFTQNIHVESLEPDTVRPMGEKNMTLLLESDTYGTGLYEASYAAFALEWDADPELTGNAALGIPRNPILTPSRINFHYTGTATFPFDPASFTHATCTNDFSDPNNLRVCPAGVPQQ